MWITRWASSNNIFGSITKERARATRCFWPPDEVEISRSANSKIPTFLSHFRALSLRSNLSTPRIFRLNSTVSRADRNGNRASDYQTSVGSRSSGCTSFITLPPRRISPILGASSPASIRRVVVLPQPDGPMMARNSPSRVLGPSSLTVTKFPKCFWTLSKTANASLMVGYSSLDG